MQGRGATLGPAWHEPTRLTRGEGTGPWGCPDSLSCPSLHPAVDEQNKQTQAYRGSAGPSKKDSSEELNKEEERLSKMPRGHVAFWGGMRVSRGIGSG